MTNSKALGLVGVCLLAYGAVASYTAGLTPIQPKHEVAPRMDVYAPVSCAKTMQELNLRRGIDVTVSMDTFIMMRDKLQACGGNMVLEN